MYTVRPVSEDSKVCYVRDDDGNVVGSACPVLTPRKKVGWWDVAITTPQAIRVERVLCVTARQVAKHLNL